LEIYQKGRADLRNERTELSLKPGGHKARADVLTTDGQIPLRDLFFE